DPADRYMVDIDVLVPRKRLDDCVATMRRHGYRALQPNDAGSHHYPPLVHPDSIASVELHLDPLDKAYGEFLGMTDIIDSAVPLDISGVSACIPAVWCRIVHSIVHAELSDHGLMLGRIAIRELCDLALLMRTFGHLIDWPTVLNRFERRGSTARDYHLL